MRLQTLLRLLEMIICAVLFTLWYTLGAYGRWTMITCGTVFGFLIITAVLLALEFYSFDDTAIYILVGAILFLLCGIVMFIDLPGSHSDSYKNSLIASILFLANGVIFVIDFIVVIMRGGGSY